MKQVEFIYEYYEVDRTFYSDKDRLLKDLAPYFCGVNRNKKIEVTTKKQLNDLYKNSAFTLEGLDISEESINKLIEWFNAYGGIRDPLSIFITKGSFMNEAYQLTDDSAYPNDLNIVSIKLENIKDVFKMSIPIFDIGARWFSDIVDNNRVRQNQIDGIEDEEEY